MPLSANAGYIGSAPLLVAAGGTGCLTASITCFNNITGLSAGSTTGTTSTSLVFSTSPTLVTPALGTPSALVLTNATGLPAAQVTSPSLTAGSGGSLVFIAPAGYVYCTSTCTVTPPVPAAGYQFCVFNDPGVSTVITVGGNTNIYYEKPDGSAYGTVSGHLTAGGANLDSICVVGRDATHYTLGAQHGTWTAS